MTKNWAEWASEYAQITKIGLSDRRADRRRGKIFKWWWHFGRLGADLNVNWEMSGNTLPGDNRKGLRFPPRPQQASLWMDGGSLIYIGGLRYRANDGWSEVCSRLSRAWHRLHGEGNGGPPHENRSVELSFHPSRGMVKADVCYVE